MIKQKNNNKCRVFLYKYSCIIKSLFKIVIKFKILVQNIHRTFEQTAHA